MDAMVWLLVAVVVLILGATAVVASGRWGQMPALDDERLVDDLPAGELGADDLREVRFAVVPRGYSMAEVDRLLARVAEQLDQVPVEPATPALVEVEEEPPSRPRRAGMGNVALDAE